MDLRITDMAIQDIFDRIFNLHPLLEKPYFDDALTRYLDDNGQVIHPDSIMQQFEDYLEDDRKEKIRFLVKNYMDDVMNIVRKENKEAVIELIDGYDDKRIDVELEKLCNRYPETILSKLMKQLSPELVDIIRDMSPERKMEQLKNVCNYFEDEVKQIMKPSRKQPKENQQEIK